MATLYIVATPIGNMEDVSKRALRILSEVDLILCEDTRETRKLLERHEIKKPLISYHQHSKLEKVEEIVSFLKSGKDLALVSDAGTPGISDPGNALIAEIVKEDLEVSIVPLPGPSALISAASASGFAMDRFTFLGFPPTKKKRKKFFEEVANSIYPVIFYESTYRIRRSLEEMEPLILGRDVVVCRELTKKFETIYRGSIEKILTEIDERGEFVVIVNKKN